ncbi:hypothetical protein QBC45DRAFT_334637 [Copromyces sp. CBS 386.78]|nr:hypothetical protein QBC45DRAFT_334637 [Copromyces sp. CBS 386.78]
MNLDQLSNRTCTHNGFPGPGRAVVPENAPYFAMRYWNESLVGMTQCCSPNEVHVGGETVDEGCVLWCVIPDSYLLKGLKQDVDGIGMTVDMAAVGGMMSSCASEKGGFKGQGYSYKSGLGAPAHLKDEASASSRIPVGRTTLLGVGVWALLAVGLLV